MNRQTEKRLVPNLSAAGALAFSLGTSIGWGSLVVTSNTYLAQAGPAGSVFGLLIGAVIMLILSKSYAYLMDCYPEAGGAYAYCRTIFGYDYGFLAGWFLALTYLAILWANATSLPLFARYFLGDLFEFGYLYRIFGYDVYLGEALLSIVFVLLTAFLCARFRNAAISLMIGLVALFSVGIALCFAGAAVKGGLTISPAFVPEGRAFGQIVRIAVMSPWAFIGFECICHGTEEFSFPKSRIFRVLVTSVIATTALYILVTVLSVTAYPEGYANWLHYIRDLGNLSGIEALPAFYAARPTWAAQASSF